MPDHLQVQPLLLGGKQRHRRLGAHRLGFHLGGGTSHEEEKLAVVLGQDLCQRVSREGARAGWCQVRATGEMEDRKGELKDCTAVQRGLSNQGG